MEALLLIDIQNDFCPGGKLPVNEGDQVVPLANKLMDQFEHVIMTQDWHPEGHQSFASNHSFKEAYETVEMDYGTQVLWPDHCIIGSEGADFHPDLQSNKATAIIRKGFRPHIDSYSAFTENDKQTGTGLEGLLKSLGIQKVYLCGLATDFCVAWSALDSQKLGFETVLIEDACRGIDLEGSLDQAMKEMHKAGVKFIQSGELLSDG
jgi:nicotinamidase/pyrazinamidase